MNQAHGVNTGEEAGGTALSRHLRAGLRAFIYSGNLLLLGDEPIMFVPLVIQSQRVCDLIGF